MAGPVDVTVTTPAGTSATANADQFTYVPAPAVTGLSPVSGPTAGGTPVTISGADFTGATDVSFGPNAAITYTVDNATTITAASPAGSGIVHVMVTTPSGVSATSSTDQFTYVPQPVVTAVSPTSGPSAGGTPVTISGTDFTGASGVSFGATAATTFTVDNGTQITATSPAGSGAVNVTVTTTGGVSATGVADLFSYIAAPSVNSVVPRGGVLGGGASITITGTDFEAVTAVKFGATAATAFNVDNATQITATNPAGSAGTVNVTVTTASGTSATSTADTFTYTAAPGVTAVSPSRGPTAGGTSVTITGINFTGATGVSFGAIAATAFNVANSTQITATSPSSSAGSVDMTITSAGGTSGTSFADRFAYTDQCATASVSVGGATSAVVGKIVHVVASSTGCPSPSYEFSLKASTTSWRVVRSLGGSTWDWSTKGYAAGTYTIRVGANQPGYGTTAIGSVVLKLNSAAGSCTAAGISFSGPSSRLAGTTIDFTATSRGCSSPLFEFRVRSPSRRWTVGRTFNSLKTWTWKTAGTVPGNYIVEVWANKMGHAVNTWEAYANASLTLTGCYSASLDPSSATGEVASTLLFRATSGGCPTPLYEFRARYPDGTWHVVRGFGSSPDLSWNTNGLASGSYAVEVWANEHGAYLGSAEALASSAVTLTGCTTATLGPSLAIGEAGTTVMFGASSGGCSNPQYQFRVSALGGAWRVVRSFSSDSTFIWNTKGYPPASYTMEVWVNQQGASTARAESFADGPVTLTGCATVTITVTPASSSVKQGTTITINASSTGCANPVYELRVRDPRKVWHVLWKFTSGAVSLWGLKTATWPKGTWTFQVWGNSVNSDYARYQALASATRTII